MSSLSLPFQSSQDILRLKQIASLKTLDYDVKEIKSGAEYHIRFLAGTQWTVLQIHLPSRFPKERPKLIISPRIRHEWLSDSGQVLHAPLYLNFTESTDLGRLVQSIIEECKKYSVTKMSHYSITRQMHTIAPLPPFIPELESLSLDELEDLNTSEAKLANFIEKLPLAAAVSSDIEQQMSCVEQLARKNMEIKSGITKLREKLLDSYSQLNKAKEAWNVSNVEYQTFLQRYVPSNVESSLHQAAVAAEDKSEEIAEKFLSKQMDVESFISTYAASRALSNTRKVKEEILHKQLEELQRLGF